MNVVNVLPKSLERKWINQMLYYIYYFNVYSIFPSEYSGSVIPGDMGGVGWKAHIRG